MLLALAGLAVGFLIGRWTRRDPLLDEIRDAIRRGDPVVIHVNFEAEEVVDEEGLR
jgi:hypothetical protein